MHFACHEMGYDRKLRIPKELRHAALAARLSVGFRVWELTVSLLGRLAMLSQPRLATGE